MIFCFVTSKCMKLPLCPEKPWRNGNIEMQQHVKVDWDLRTKQLFVSFFFFLQNDRQIWKKHNKYIFLRWFTVPVAVRPTVHDTEINFSCHFPPVFRNNGDIPRVYYACTLFNSAPVKRSALPIQFWAMSVSVQCAAGGRTIAFPEQLCVLRVLANEMLNEIFSSIIYLLKLAYDISLRTRSTFFFFVMGTKMKPQNFKHGSYCFDHPKWYMVIKYTLL